MLFNLTRLLTTVLLVHTVSFSFLNDSHSVAAYQRRPQVEGDRVEPKWFADESGFWYQRASARDGMEYYYVDALAGERSIAFDHPLLAKKLSELTGQNISPNRLPIQDLQLDREQAKLRIELEPTGVLTWDPQTEALEVVEKPSINTGRGERFLFSPVRPSRSGGDSISMDVFNQLDQPIELLWVNPDRELIAYATIEPGQSWSTSTYEGHVWLVKKGEESIGYFSANRNRAEYRITQQTIDNVQTTRERANERSARPRRGSGGQDQPNRSGNRNRSQENRRVVVRDHNLWLIEQDGEAFQLTSDATAKNSFRRNASRARLVSMRFDQPDFGEDMADFIWSPCRGYLIANQTTQVDERKVYYVEADPPNELQPILRNYSYAKPGDPIPVSQPRLFRIATSPGEDGDDGEASYEEIPLDHSLWANPFSLSFERWSVDGQIAYFYFNQRGHQVVSLIALELSTGEVRTAVEERTGTFVHYSTGAKSFRRWLTGDDQNMLLWASERSGWNHIYRYDMNTGELINAVTSGDWNVREIERVDEDNQVIWFYAVGIHPDQDPYHRHFCRVNFDGSNLQVLTDGDGTHSVLWSPSRKWLIAGYSRVDLPPIHELRQGETGQLICEVERAEWVQAGNRRSASSWLMPERFVAKGRDGETDIWGIVHWPRDFDPDKKYAVVESIYAGPHDHHVPKSFRTGYGRQRQIADAGFIVVQIDGMGTAWRSKAFHDVCYQNLKDAGFPDRILWIKALAEKYPSVDSGRVGVYGGSAGGQNAMAALLWFNDFYQVAVADCGCHDNRMDKIWWNEQWMGEVGDGQHYIDSSNMENAGLLKGHLMLTVGMLDRNVDPATTLQVVNRLMKANKDFTFLPIVDGGHGAGEIPYASAKRLDFFRQHLGEPVPLEAGSH